MKKVISPFILFYPLCFMLLFLVACGQDGASPGAGGEGETTLPVTLSFRLPEVRKVGVMSKAAASNVDTIEITVTGEGMSEITDTLNVNPGEEVSRTLEIPIGLARFFAVIVFDFSGKAVYGGTSPSTDVIPGEITQVNILLHPLLINLPSELPRLSDNYLLLDVVGTSPFVEPSNSANYATTVGIPALKGEPSTSENYTLR